MRRVTRLMLFVCLACLSGGAAFAQQGPAASASVPRLVRVTGSFHQANGVPPAAVETITFSVYAEESGGAPLFQETQNVVLGEGGQYAVLLGATVPDGLPSDLFASGEARWLAIHVERAGETEQPRLRLASVPYALRAVDADTLGGRPASAYLLAPDATTASTTSNHAATRDGAPNTVLPGTANFLAKYVDGVDVGPSAVYENGGTVGVGTATPFDALHVRFDDTTGRFTGYAVQNTASGAASYSGMLFYDQNGAISQFQGFNNATHEYRINNIASGASINFMIGSNSKFRIANNGDIQFQNSAVLRVPNLESIGLGNNAFAIGTGSFNTALGTNALRHATTGGFATALGAYALDETTTSLNNTAVGYSAASTTTTGSNNIAIGFFAGTNPAPTSSDNIEIGTFGDAADSGTIRLGTNGTQTSFFAAGIRGVTTGAADAVSVVIDSNGQLGTVNSSRRYKEDIRDMGDASSGLMKLRPVTFRYSKPYADGSKPIDYGLIAEEVETVYPDLVAHLADGQIETVQYNKINAMLLNEVQKQHRTLDEQRSQLAAQQAEIDLLKGRLAALEAKRD
jgi:Chaperone of endosialidase